MSTITTGNPFELLGDGPINPSQQETNITSTTKSKTTTRDSSRPQRGNTKTVTVDELIKKDKDNRNMRGKARGHSRGRGTFRGRGSFHDRHGTSHSPRHGGFDRHSSSGRTETPKASNAGWGDEKGIYDDEAKKAKAAVSSTDNEIKQLEEPEAEDNSLTYGEYLASRAQMKLTISDNDLRKPNQGTDDSKWKDGLKLIPKAHELYNKKTDAKVTKIKKDKPMKVRLQFEAKFNTPPVSGRGSSDRGRNSSEKGKIERKVRNGDSSQEGGRSRGSSANPPPIGDQKSFPKLVSK